MTDTTRKGYTAEEFEGQLHVGEATTCPCVTCAMLRQAAAQARVLEKLKDQLGNDPTRLRRHLSAYDDGRCDAMETAFVRLMTLLAEEGLA